MTEMSKMSKEELEQALNECNDDIEQLKNKLIVILNNVPFENVDLYSFINELSILKTRKHKISYILSLK